MYRNLIATCLILLICSSKESFAQTGSAQQHRVFADLLLHTDSLNAIYHSRAIILADSFRMTQRDSLRRSWPKDSPILRFPPDMAHGDGLSRFSSIITPDSRYCQAILDDSTQVELSRATCMTYFAGKSPNHRFLCITGQARLKILKDCYYYIAEGTEKYCLSGIEVTLLHAAGGKLGIIVHEGKLLNQDY